MVANFIRGQRAKIILVLLYRGTRDGWTTDNIHQKIDDEGPTVTLVKTSKGNIFGGFTNASWDKASGFKSDSEAFVFSVDTGAKYPVDKNQAQKAICCSKSRGPYFGFNFFYVNANAKSGMNCYVYRDSAVYPNTPKHVNAKTMFLEGDEYY